jgi:hypothetical protein
MIPQLTSVAGRCGTSPEQSRGERLAATRQHLGLTADLDHAAATAPVAPSRSGGGE